MSEENYPEAILGQSKRQNDALERIAGALERIETLTKDCTGNNLCTACKTFVCHGCRMLRPWCVGAADDYPDWCDDCVSANAPSHASDDGSAPPKAAAT